MEAFQIQGRAITGPDWLTSTRFEIIAKVPVGSNRDDVPEMLQRLIIERFGMKFHREPKEVPGYGLVIGKNGPKLKPSTDRAAPIAGRAGFADIVEGVAPGVINVESVGLVHRLVAGAMSMAEFAGYLANPTASPVVDLTELRGRYDIVFYYSKPLPISTNSEVTPAENGFDLMSALREQLGLELQARKVKMEMLVIDHIEQTPSAN